jgi:hypothetical protein
MWISVKSSKDYVDISKFVKDFVDISKRYQGFCGYQ